VEDPLTGSQDLVTFWACRGFHDDPSDPLRPAEDGGGGDAERIRRQIPGQSAPNATTANSSPSAVSARRSPESPGNTGGHACTWAQLACRCSSSSRCGLVRQPLYVDRSQKYFEDHNRLADEATREQLLAVITGFVAHHSRRFHTRAS
jgi:hypothetical protein